MNVKEKLNPARAALLRKLFTKRDKLNEELVKVDQSIDKLAREYWQEEGCLIRPTHHRLRDAVFRLDDRLSPVIR